MFVNSFSTEMLPEKLIQKSGVKILLNKKLFKKLPLRTFAKNSRNRIVPKNLSRKSATRNNPIEMLLKNCRSKLSSNISVANCCQRN